MLRAAALLAAERVEMAQLFGSVFSAFDRGRVEQQACLIATLRNAIASQIHIRQYHCGVDVLLRD